MVVAVVTARGIPALTLINPWAHAITDHGKTVENRSWAAPHHVEKMWLHAGRSWDDAGTARLSALGCQHEAVSSAIVALVYLNGVCVAEPKMGGGCDCGEWAADGQYHWSLEIVRVLPEPVRCRGYQGLWHPEPHLVELLDQQLA